jgi:hypothetical protein
MTDRRHERSLGRHDAFVSDAPSVAASLRSVMPLKISAFEHDNPTLV